MTTIFVIVGITAGLILGFYIGIWVLGAILK